MKAMKFLFLIAVLILAACTANSEKKDEKVGRPSIQQITKSPNSYDSLLKIIKSPKKDIGNVDALNYLGQFTISTNMDSTQMLAAEAKKLAKKLHYTYGEAWAEFQLGRVKYFTGDAEKALFHYNNTIKMGEKALRSKNTPDNKLAKSLLAFSFHNKAMLYMFDPDKSIPKNLLLTGLKYAEESDDIFEINRIHNAFGLYYRNIGNLSNNVLHNRIALIYAKKSGDKMMLCRAYGNLGGAFAELSDYPNALEYSLKSLEIAEKEGFEAFILQNLGTIGNINMQRGDYDKALKYHSRALKICERTGNKRQIGTSLSSVGNVNLYKKNTEVAIEYYHKAIKMDSLSGAFDRLPNCYANIGEAYQIQGNYLKAIENYKFALDLAEKSGDRKQYCVILAALGNTNEQLGNYKLAETLLLEAIKITETVGVKLHLKEQHEFLYNLYEKTERPALALEHYRTFIKIRDELFSQENNKKLMRSEMDSEYEKKVAATKSKQEKKDLIALKESQRQRLILFSVLIALLIVIVFSVFAIKQRREISKANKDLQIAKLKAEQSEAFKQQFLANMSHEIRTPMNAVMGMTNLVLDTPLETKQRDYLTKVKKSSDNLLHIINDILDLSKIEAGKMELEEIDFSLSDMVDQVKQTLVHKAEEKGLELVIKIDPQLNDIVMGDPVRLNQTLINLAGNAIKFTENGSVLIEVKKEGEKVRFQVIDTGIGIPEDKVNTVFEKFGQANTSDTRKYGGTGLGLSISQQLVELMGGTIEIESEVGRGTKFYFDITFKEGDKVRYEERIAGEENVDGSILDGLTILVADDNEYNRIVAKDTLLSKANVTIIEAENGQEAINKLSEKVDVILMDAQMPILNGFDATRKIRELQNEKLSKVPVIALTASVLRTDLDRCKDAGMNGYIPKPFKAHELIVGIAEALNIKLKLNKTKKEEIVKESIPSSLDMVTDLNYLSEFCEGDKEKMKKYIDMFLKSAPAFLEKLDELIKAEDAEGIANQVHGFNTKLTMMGMKETKSLSVEIENRLREDRTISSVQTILNSMKANVQLAMNELNG